MKSTVLSLLILIAIFVLFKYGALSFIGSRAFHVTAFVVLAIVIAAAAYFVGFKDKRVNPGQSNVPPTQEDQADEK